MFKITQLAIPGASLALMMLVPTLASANEVMIMDADRVSYPTAGYQSHQPRHNQKPTRGISDDSHSRPAFENQQRQLDRATQDQDRYTDRGDEGRRYRGRDGRRYRLQRRHQRWHNRGWSNDNNQRGGYYDRWR
jgi:hypothetical protein